MRAMFIAGFILVVLGVGGLMFSVIPIRYQEPIARIGPITAVQDKTEDIVIPPYGAVLVILVGGALILAGRRTG